jgi:hypothetical protein
LFTKEKIYLFELVCDTARHGSDLHATPFMFCNTDGRLLNKNIEARVEILLGLRGLPNNVTFRPNYSRAIVPLKLFVSEKGRQCMLVMQDVTTPNQL